MVAFQGLARRASLRPWQRPRALRAKDGWGRRWPVVVIGIASLLSVLPLGACRSNTPPPLPVEMAVPEERPADFVLAATVYSPKSMEKAKLPRSLRAARYIVEADGVLRAAVGPGSEATTFPGQTRRLTPREFDGLWRMVRESGLLDAGSAWRVENPEEITRASDRTTALVYVSFEGRRTTLRLLLDRSGPEAVAAERVIDRLAEWAWMGE
jgi:hypothetical protein